MPGILHRPTVRALAVLALAAAVATPASGQEQTTELPSQRLPGWTFTPGVVFGVLYDTNATLSSPDVDRNTPSDRLVRMQPFGQLEYFTPRTSFASGYQGTVRRYLDLSGLNGTDHQAYFSLRERVTRRVTLYANDSYSQVPTTDQLDLGGIPFQQGGARYNSLAGGVEARLTRNTDFVARYEMTWVDFVRKDTLLTGGIVHGLGGEITRRFTERVSAGAEYGTRWADLNAGTSGALFHEAGGVFHYRTGEATTFNVSAGAAHFLGSQHRRHPHRPVRAGGADPSGASGRRSASLTAAATCRRWPSAGATRAMRRAATSGCRSPATGSTFRNRPPGGAPTPSSRPNPSSTRSSFRPCSAMRSRSGSASRAITRSLPRTTASPADRSAGISWVRSSSSLNP